MVIRLRDLDRKVVEAKSSPPKFHQRQDSPVPSLRSSSSSLDFSDLDSTPVKPSSSSRGFRWIVGLALALAVAVTIGRGMQRLPMHDNGGSAETDKPESLYKMPLPTSQNELADLNDKLAGLDPKFILQWAHHHLHDGADADERNSHPLVQATSFGPTGLVILDHLAKYNLLETIPVITMDTLHLFRESYTFYETVQSHYKSSLHLTVTKPKHEVHGEMTTKQQFQDVYGSDFWKADPKTYTKLTKSEPMHQKLEEWNAVMWITGRRRSQGGERVKLDILEFEPYVFTNATETGFSDPFHPSRGRWKLNPLAYWSYDEVWSYIRKNSVPYNTLYDQGYTSIGDEMTTSLPASKSEGERSGRFAGFGVSNKECGLHVDLDLDLPGTETTDDKMSK